MNLEMWLEVFRLILIQWGGGAVIGVLLGCWARTPVLAFLCGALAGAIGAKLLVDFVLFGVPRASDYLLVCVPPAMVAGFASAGIRAALNSRHRPMKEAGLFPLPPASEGEARSHFRPSSRPTGSDGISRADKGVKADGED
jgi:hypothetical protein